MAYDPATGQWTNEDTSVSGRLTGLMSKNTDYMKQAETQGLMAANKRGLVNSSIAVGAAQAERIKAALPIAQQEASQASQAELQGRQLQSGDVQQQRQITSTEGLAAADIASREKLTGQQIASQEKMQTTQIGATQTLQDREIANAQWAKQFDAATQTALAGMDITSREKMQREGFTQAQVLQASEQQQQQWLAQFDAGTREKLQTLDAQTRQAMQQLDIQSQEKIANLNVNENSRSEAARMATSFEIAYQTSLATIMNNPDIPADTRQTYIDHANTTRDSNLALLEQLFGIDLQW